jgi:hypothetical protein
MTTQRYASISDVLASLPARTETSILRDYRKQILQESGILPTADTSDLFRPKLLVPPLRYVVRDADLDLFAIALDALEKVAPTLVLTAMLDTSTSTRVMVGLVVVVLKAVRQVATKGIKFDADTFALLLLIHQAETGLAEENLLARLRAKNTEWNPEKLQATLRSLELCEHTPHQEPRPLVKRRADGRWYSVGI